MKIMQQHASGPEIFGQFQSERGGEIDRLLLKPFHSPEGGEQRAVRTAAPYRAFDGIRPVGPVGFEFVEPFQVRRIIEKAGDAGIDPEGFARL